MALDDEGAEVDWIVGYGPPPEKFKDKLAKVLAGEGTFKSLNAAYTQNPKDVATVALENQERPESLLCPRHWEP